MFNISKRLHKQSYIFLILRHGIFDFHCLIDCESGVFMYYDSGRSTVYCSALLSGGGRRSYAKRWIFVACWKDAPMLRKKKFPILPYASDDLSRRLYIGSIDDSVLRYPYSGNYFDIDSFNKTLIFYALIGPALCCRVGNIIYNRKLFHLLRHEQYSPLIHLARAGFFQLQMLEGSINESIGSRREIQTNSTLNFIKETGWAKGTAIYDELDAIDRSLDPGFGKLKYKAEFRNAFHKLIAMGVSANPNYLRVHQEWIKRFDVTDRTRSNFEMLCEKFLNNYEERRQAMSVINSVTHYAYGIGMTSFGIEALIETKELPRINALTTSAFSGRSDASKTNADPLAIEEMKRLKIPQIIGKYLKIPDGLFYNHEHWAVLTNLMSPGSNDFDQFIAYKQDIISRISICSLEEDMVRAKKDLKKSCQEYSRFLNNYFKYSLSGESKHKISMAFEKISYQLSKQNIEDLAMDGLKALPETLIGAAMPAIVVQGTKLVLGLTSERGHGMIKRRIDNAITDSGENDIEYIDEVSQVIDTFSIKSVVPVGFAAEE